MSEYRLCWKPGKKFWYNHKRGAIGREKLKTCLWRTDPSFTAMKSVLLLPPQFSREQLLLIRTHRTGKYLRIFEFVDEKAVERFIVSNPRERCYSALSVGCTPRCNCRTTCAERPKDLQKSQSFLKIHCL